MGLERFEEWDYWIKFKLNEGLGTWDGKGDEY